MSAPPAARLFAEMPLATVAAALWLAGRLALLLVYLAVWSAGRALPPSEVLALWDSTWYLGIARDGYAWDPSSGAWQNPVFFPLWPMLLAGARVVAGDAGLPFAGAALSSLAHLAALVGLAKLLEGRVERRAAVLALLFMAAGPTALYWSLPYTESLFFALCVALLLAWERRRPGLAAACAFALALSRSNGWLLPAAIAAVELWRARGAGNRLPQACAVAAAGAAGTLAFLAYCHLALGDATAPMRGQRAWGVEPFGFAAGYLPRMSAFLRREPGAGFGVPLDGTWALLCLAGALWAARRRGIPAEWRAFALLGALFPVLALGGDGIRSTIRYSGVLFPLWVALAAPLADRRWSAAAAAFAAVAAGAAVAARFYTGAWVQ
ncbi:MAG: hypothetical protein SF028_00310 [Candidatus Sumerlaeia bacterium]|nr:hypothetical protein [Candidatus Sumerlaeia bacterium]